MNRAVSLAIAFSEPVEPDEIQRLEVTISG
jgi:hypothetical protein